MINLNCLAVSGNFIDRMRDFESWYPLPSVAVRCASDYIYKNLNTSRLFPTFNCKWQTKSEQHISRWTLLCNFLIDALEHFLLFLKPSKMVRYAMDPLSSAEDLREIWSVMWAILSSCGKRYVCARSAREISLTYTLSADGQCLFVKSVPALL